MKTHRLIYSITKINLEQNSKDRRLLIGFCGLVHSARCSLPFNIKLITAFKYYMAEPRNIMDLFSYWLFLKLLKQEEVEKVG